MKNVIISAFVALAAVSGAASAMTDGRVDAAQETLDTYGFVVDAADLTPAQVSALANLGIDSDIERHGLAESRATNRIRAILN